MRKNIDDVVLELFESVYSVANRIIPPFYITDYYTFGAFDIFLPNKLEIDKLILFFERYCLFFNIIKEKNNPIIEETYFWFFREMINTIGTFEASIELLEFIKSNNFPILNEKLKGNLTNI